MKFGEKVRAARLAAKYSQRQLADMTGIALRTIQNYESGKDSSVWDCLYCELQADINAAEVDQMITSEQAWFLREKYLGLSRKEET